MGSHGDEGGADRTGCALLRQELLSSVRTGLRSSEGHRWSVFLHFSRVSVNSEFLI